MRLQEEKEKESGVPKAVATDSLEQYKVEATQMSTHRPDKPEQIYRMEDGGAAGSGGWAPHGPVG